jgi:hypothetical protein
MAITTRPTRLLLLSGALLTCACEQQTTTMDDALRAYDAKRYAESLRISKDIQGNATDPLTRQQAAYMAGRSASELSKNREARDAFAVASRSADPELAGRALAMQAAIAVEEKRWNDAASSYAAAASKLTGREAQRAGLQTPRVLAVSSPSKRVWIVEIGTFDQREQGESARKKFATKDTAVVRSRVPVPSKRS